MYDFQGQCQFGYLQQCVCLYFFQTMYNKTIRRFGFCDILNNQGLVKCYQPRPSARPLTLTSTLIIPDTTKTSSNTVNYPAILAVRPRVFNISRPSFLPTAA